MQEGAHSASLQFFPWMNQPIVFLSLGPAFSWNHWKSCSTTSRSSRQLKAICKYWVTLSLFINEQKKIFGVFGVCVIYWFEVSGALCFLTRCDSHSWMTFISCDRNHAAPNFVNLKAFVARFFKFLCAIAVNVVNLGTFFYFLLLPQSLEHVLTPQRLSLKAQCLLLQALKGMVRLCVLVEFSVSWFLWDFTNTS